MSDLVISITMAASGRGYLFCDHRALGIAEPGGSPGISRTKILIVEDNLILAMEVENHLHAAGFDVVGVAESAGQAMAIAADKKPDFAVMDIRLPGERDGIDTAIALLESLGVRSIFASAHGEADLQSRANAARPAGWLMKPYSMSDLVDVIRAAHSESKN